MDLVLHPQLVQNAAARLGTDNGSFDHIAPVLLSSLAPVSYPLEYTFKLLVFRSLNGLAPVYLSSTVCCVSTCSCKSLAFNTLRQKT